MRMKAISDSYGTFLRSNLSLLEQRNTGLEEVCYQKMIKIRNNLVYLNIVSRNL
jgi:hypothetical protein